MNIKKKYNVILFITYMLKLYFLGSYIWNILVDLVEFVIIWFKTRFN